MQCRRTWIRLNEKDGNVHEMPCHHNLVDSSISVVSSAFNECRTLEVFSRHMHTALST